MTLPRVVVETPCEHGFIYNHDYGPPHDPQECIGGSREDRTSFSPEAVEAAALALGEVLLIPDPTNTETTSLIMDAVEAAIRAFIAVQYGIETNEAD